nr:hypothetical protein [Tanacetum cinerariifolium]
MKDIFKQMKDEVDQCSVTKKSFGIKKKQLLINNDRLLEENIASDIMCTYLRSLNEVDNCGKCKSLDIVLLDLQESNRSLCELIKCFSKLEEYNITLNNAFQNHKEQMIFNDPETENKQFLVKTVNNQSVEINDLKVQFQDKLHFINELKHLLAQKSQKTQCELPGTDIYQKNKAKTDKTGHENGKSAKNQSRRRAHLKSNPVNPLTLKKPKNYYTEALLAAPREKELREQEQAAQEKGEPPQNSDFRQLVGESFIVYLIESALNSKLLSINLKSQRLDKEKQKVKNIVEQAPKCRTRLMKCLDNFIIIHNESSISLNNTSQISPVNAIAPVLPTEEPNNSLTMRDEHPSTIPETELNEVIKSSVKNLAPIPSESKVTSDNESECDVPVNDESSPIFTTFSNHLFDCNDDFTFSDDKSLFNEDVPKENFKIYSNHLFYNEIISRKIDPHHFNAEFDLIEFLLNRDTLIDSSPKFDYFLEEFSGELAHIDPVPRGIEEANFDLEEELRLIVNLFESQMEEIDLFLATDDLMPPGIENDDYNSKGDIYFLELLSNDTLSLPENESFNFDHHDDPSFPRPPPKPLDVEIFFDFEHNTGVLIAKMVEDVSKHYVLMPKVLPTQPALCPNIDTLLLFSSKNKDKVFKLGILSYLLISHRDKITLDFSENPMMYEGDIPLLDVLIAPDLKASRARGFVYCPLELQSFAYGNPIS